MPFLLRILCYLSVCQAFLILKSQTRHASFYKYPEKINYPFLVFKNPTIPKYNNLKRLNAANHPNNVFEGDFQHHSDLQRISSPYEHISLLIDALHIAKKKLLITSYDIHGYALQHMNFYFYLRQAIRRGVKVYIYYNIEKVTDYLAIDALKKMDGVLCEPTYTHSKFLCVDNHLVAIGSFNWLSSYMQIQADKQTEGTMISYNKSINKKLNTEIWNHLVFYRNLQYGNFNHAKNFYTHNNINSLRNYEISQQSGLIYLPTLEMHRNFFQGQLKHAKKKIIICSPFLSLKQFFADINRQILQRLSTRGVKLFFITSDNNKDYTKLAEYLFTVNHQNIRLINCRDFHTKTIIIDDTIIADGSFNWLSAAREYGEHHNHEATLVAYGESAKKLICQFYKTDIGKKLPKIYDPGHYRQNQFGL